MIKIRNAAAAVLLAAAGITAAAGVAAAAPLAVTPITTDDGGAGAGEPLTGSAELLPLLITGSANATPGTGGGTGGAGE